MADRDQPDSIAARVDAELDGVRLRVLIVGAGIAGATLGALMRQRGEPAAIVERSGPDAEEGYMLGILPLGGRVLNGLGLREAYVEASIPIADYSLYSRNGKLIRTYPSDGIVEQFGLYNGIGRGAFLDLLRAKAGGIIHHATVRSIHRDVNTAHRDPRRNGSHDGEGAKNTANTIVTFNDGSHTNVDLVVAADGIHSPTRTLILHDDEVDHFDSGWGGYVAWCETRPDQQHRYCELWGTGFFVGLYPVPGHTGIFLGGPTEEVKPLDPFTYAASLHARGLPEPFAHALDTIDRSDQPVYWPMADIRSKVWSRDRVVLLGDAAAAFLPTAGVGASAAMDAASALSDELARADRDHLEFALALYERRQRRRTELAQKNSRDLSGLMFERSPTRTFLRDQVARVYSGTRMLDDIGKVMEGR